MAHEIRDSAPSPCCARWRWPPAIQAPKQSQWGPNLLPKPLKRPHHPRSSRPRACRSGPATIPALAERRAVRMLVVYSKTFYFIDKGQQRGITYDMGMELEKHLNAKNKDKTRPIRVRVHSGGTRQAAAVAGRRHRRHRHRRSHDHSREQQAGRFHGCRRRRTSARSWSLRPMWRRRPRVDELSGRSVYVRPSSAYHESLVALNARLTAAGKKPVEIVAAEENLEDEDILEMVNAGLVDATVVNSYVAEFWKEIFPKIQPQPAIALRTNAQIAWAIRKDSPGIQEGARCLCREESHGHHDGQHALQALSAEHPLGARRHQQGGHAPLQRTHRLFQEVRHAVRLRLVAARGAGLPGIGARPEHAQPGGSHRCACR